MVRCSKTEEGKRKGGEDDGRVLTKGEERKLRYCDVCGEG